MTARLENFEIDQLADELARATGETANQAIKIALRERLQRVKNHRPGAGQLKQ